MGELDQLLLSTHLARLLQEALEARGYPHPFPADIVADVLAYAVLHHVRILADERAREERP